MRWIICCMALAILLGVGKTEASVTISSAWHGVDVYNSDSGEHVSQSTDSTTIPESLDITAAIDSGSAITHLSRSTTSWDSTFTHDRPVSSGSLARSAGYYYFTVTDTSVYTISGTYAMTGPGAIALEAILYDETGSYTVVDSYQHSIAATDELFTLGLTEGNSENRLLGSLTGTLEPGHSYRFSYIAFIDSFPASPNATAAGNVSISFGNSAVPEPCTLAIWSMFGAVGMAGGWLRRRKAV
jgi:hypothetical protein